MAADVVSARGVPVVMFEKNRVPGRKLLIAGSSGLNITHDCPLEELPGYYGEQAEAMRPILAAFPPSRWLEFVESLGIETFKGTSRRYFVRGLKASKLLRAWMRKLAAQGVEFRYGKVFRDFECLPGGVRVEFEDGSCEEFTAVILALGGASYEKSPPRWPDTFRAKGLHVIPFQAANVGYQVAWPAAFLAEAEGLPLKNIALTTARGTRVGDLMVTRYGLEGTPIYTLGVSGPATLDLKPDLSAEQIYSRLSGSKENLSPLRRVRKSLNLSPAANALLFHLAKETDLKSLAVSLKAFPLQLGDPQPIQEAISSSGGLDFSELTPNLMLRQFPGVFAAGEMLNWSAPTGGFLIQGCVSQGYVAGRFLE